MLKHNAISLAFNLSYYNLYIIIMKIYIGSTQSTVDPNVHQPHRTAITISPQRSQVARGQTHDLLHRCPLHRFSASSSPTKRFAAVLLRFHCWIRIQKMKLNSYSKKHGNFWCGTHAQCMFLRTARHVTIWALDKQSPFLVLSGSPEFFVSSFDIKSTKWPHLVISSAICFCRFRGGEFFLCHSTHCKIHHKQPTAWSWKTRDPQQISWDELFISHSPS